MWGLLNFSPPAHQLSSQSTGLPTNTSVYISFAAEKKQKKTKRGCSLLHGDNNVSMIYSGFKFNIWTGCNSWILKYSCVCICRDIQIFFSPPIYPFLTFSHARTLPLFIPGRTTIKRPAALLDPWPLIPGGLPLPALEVEEGWGSDKRRGHGGALRTTPSVRAARAASWVSSPSSVHWPSSCAAKFGQTRC